MKRIISVILISIIMICCVGCESPGNIQDETGVDTSEIPCIVYLVRTDTYDLVQEEFVGKWNLAFYDSDGNFYLSDDPDVLDMDNETLIVEYEAGRLNDKIQLSASCDAAILAEQYAKMHNIYLKEQLEIVYSEEKNLEIVAELSRRSSSLTNCSTWYGFYADENGDIQYQIIHKRVSNVQVYTDNESVNEIYDWLQEVSEEQDMKYWLIPSHSEN
ncbi:MAG: hypothetical protein J6K58_11470 [Lachnospiraceae bacterium]|nr:hypothetical protein [Lachnospiraceae bacterium]